MRHLIHLLFLACLLTACGGGSPTVTSTTVPLPTETSASTPTLYSGPWQLVVVHNVHHSVMIAGFLNEDFGITGGVIGYMYYTTDGGQYWYEGTNQSDCRYGMDIVDTSVAWTCGGMMHVRLSTDGGQSWRAVTDFGQGTTKPCHTISFLDEKTGWVATLYMFGATEDGGQTWTMVPQPIGLDDIASIDLYAPGKGYLLDFFGVLYATQDNGARWTTVARLDLAGLVIPKAAYQMAAMRFSDAEHGLIVVSEEYQKGQVMAFHTADGGATWTSESVPVISGPVFLSRDENLLTVITGANIMTLMRYIDQ